MIRFVILLWFELLKSFLRACWARWEEIWRGEYVEIRQARFRVGASVRYVCADGKCRTAIITRIGENAALGQCALRAANGEVTQSAYFDPRAAARGSWHWSDGAPTL